MLCSTCVRWSALDGARNVCGVRQRRLLQISIVFVLLMCCACPLNAFNLDTQNFARFGGHSQSMFGFSVATHRAHHSSWVLIGAPEAQSSQPNVQRGGAVFRCQSDVDNSCQEVMFDTKGSNYENQVPIDEKSHQWFGATLQSAGEDGPILACAPRYVYFGMRGDRRDPVGTCYVSSSDFTRFSEYSPCRTRFFGYHRQGSCQAGFSAALTNDGNRLFVGAPGSYYWQGQVYSIDANATFPYTPGIFTVGAFGSGQVVQQPLEKRPAVVSTNEGEAYEDDSYLGYSMAVGDFTGDGEQGVAVGKPRGARLMGQINLFSWNLTNYQNISLGEYGSQIGTYFGYCVAAADVDGDQTDDLIVGAPLHVEPDNKGKYEVGRVYVIYQGKDYSNRFRRFNTIDGFKSKSRFGLSLAALGDINMDGFADFAVGAPYDGPNERGAIYIYHGVASLVDAKYSQVVYSEDVSPGMPINTFGFSLAGGIDVDQNQYPDLAVGAYLSDTAFLFRARPIVKIDSKVNFLNRNKKIVLEEKNCTLHSGLQVACTKVQNCMRYLGRGVPTTLDLDVQYILDTKKMKDPRMYFIGAENMTTHTERVRLYKDQGQVCKEKMIYIKNNIRDKLTALEVEVRYAMILIEPQHQVRDPRRVLLPVLDANDKQSNKDSLTIHKNCGADNICVPDLKLEVTTNVERFLLGSNEKLEFDVVVHNMQEDSFESTFEMELPEGVHFNKVIQANVTEQRVLCTLGNKTIHCDIGNPLPAFRIAKFKLLINVAHHKEGMNPSYNFKMFVNSTNPETESTRYDNVMVKSIPIWVNAHLELVGMSNPGNVFYNVSNFAGEKITTESDIGPQVIHWYQVKNHGPSEIKKAEVIFLLPYATLDNEDLLYLLDQPYILGNMECGIVEANYRGYDLEVRKKSVWETLDISTNEFAAMGQTGGLLITEGHATHGSTPKDFKHTSQKTDRVQTAEERRQKAPGGAATTTGNVVHVAQDTGSGSKVSETHVEHGATRNMSTSTSHGGSSHFETHHSSTTHSGSGGSYTHSMSASNSSSSGSSGSSGSHASGQGINLGIHSGQGHTRGESSDQYTSQGKQTSDGSISFTVGSGGGTTSSSSAMTHASSSGGAMSSGTFVEEKKSGQVLNASQGGHTVYQEGTYRPPPSHETGTKHFNWGAVLTSPHVTSGRPNASSADIYEENRRFYEERRRVEEEKRIQEHERRMQQEKQQREEEHRRRLEQEQQQHRPQAAGRDEAERRAYDEWRQQEEHRRQQEWLRREEEYQRQYTDAHRQHQQHAEVHHGSTVTTPFPIVEESYVRSDEEDEEDYQTVQERNRSHQSHSGYSGHSNHGLAGVAAGSGFHTGTLDLGTLAASSGGATQGLEGGRTASTHWRESHSESWSSHGTGAPPEFVGRDNVATDKPNYQNRHYGRKKRQAQVDQPIEEFRQCKSTKCYIVRCSLGPLAKEQSAKIAFRSRVNIRTLRNITTSQSINFSSMMLARIDQLPYIGRPLNRSIHYKEAFTTVVAPEPEIKPDIIPLWVIVLSAVGGTILLLLLIYLLHKAGFFKRNRPSNAPERQPLNRNAYYNGDQAL